MKKKTEEQLELEKEIELLDEIINDGDMACAEQLLLQQEYKKRFGHEHEY